MKSDFKKTPSDELKSIAAGKIRTTMIGALSAIEEALGPLWNHGQEDKTPDQEAIFSRFTEARKKILDNGHIQIKNLERQLEVFEILKKRFQLRIPVLSTVPTKTEDVQ